MHPQHEFTNAVIVPEKLTRGQRAILRSAAQPEGTTEAAHDWRNVEKLACRGLIEKSGVVWIITKSGESALAGELQAAE
jgi:hypothetical protein